MNDNKLQTEFIDLLENNRKLIYKISLMYCDNNIDKKDLFQDIVSNLWTAYPSFQNKSKASTWVYRVSLNTAITWFRDYSKQSKKIEYTSIIPHLSDEPDSVVEELHEQLYTAINALGKIDKAIVLLLLEECSYEEIADVIGISKTNVATKISRIKLKLKSHFTNV